LQSYEVLNELRWEDNHELWTGKDLDRGNLDLFSFTIPPFTYRD
jgi:hypothetical protein